MSMPAPYPLQLELHASRHITRWRPASLGAAPLRPVPLGGRGRDQSRHPPKEHGNGTDPQRADFRPDGAGHRRQRRHRPATALGLAALGAHLAITARDRGRTEETAREIRTAGVELELSHLEHGVA